MLNIGRIFNIESATESWEGTYSYVVQFKNYENQKF